MVSDGEAGGFQYADGRLATAGVAFGPF